METLFASKIHIKDLAVANMLTFIRQTIRPSNMSDIAMIKIYSRPYSRREIDDAATQINQFYSVPPADIAESLASLMRVCNPSPLSLQARLLLEAV